MNELASRIQDRVAHAGLVVPDAVVEGCAVYLELLHRWNQTINLTALPLGPAAPDSSIDKLAIEPLFASKYMPDNEIRWVDLGSGGGSPALPLRVAHRRGRLTMVESRERKCAFLRAAARALSLQRTEAEARRFEEFAESGADVITFRAVRVDAAFTSLLARVGSPSVRLICFGSTVDDPSFLRVGGETLPDGSVMAVYDRVS